MNNRLGLRAVVSSSPAGRRRVMHEEPAVEVCRPPAARSSWTSDRDSCADTYINGTEMEGSRCLSNSPVE